MKDIKEVITFTEYIEQTVHKVWNAFWLKMGISTTILLPKLVFGIDIKIILILSAMFFLDFLTGVLRSFATGEKIQSRKMMRSVIKWSLYCTFIAGSWLISLIFKEYLPIHEWAILLAILIEFVSILENIRASGIAIPSIVDDWIKKTIETLNGKK